MTAPPGSRRRGEPLAALVLLVASWTGVRSMLWDAPDGLRPLSEPPPLAAAPRAVAGPEPLFATQGADRSTQWSRGGTDAPVLLAKTPAPRGWPARPLAAAPGPGPLGPPSSAWKPISPAAELLPTSFPDAVASPPRRVSTAPRWRVDGWAAWRQGSGLPRVAAGARPAAYGGSQVGVAARFLLADTRRQPALHLRASYAPDRPRQAEVALGAGARPLRQLPVRAQAELRATRAAGETELRPALFAVTELAPVALPLGLTAEAYGQAGWVGGRYATPFADGQARLTREALRAGPLRLSAGAGTWGGAQRFAERLDVGPTIELELAEGPAPLRLSVDYRVRVAGAAAPGSGLAVTVSSGF